MSSKNPWLIVVAGLASLGILAKSMAQQNGGSSFENDGVRLGFQTSEARFGETDAGTNQPPYNPWQRQRSPMESGTRSIGERNQGGVDQDFGGRVRLGARGSASSGDGAGVRDRARDVRARDLSARDATGGREGSLRAPSRAFRGETGRNAAPVGFGDVDGIPATDRVRTENTPSSSRFEAAAEPNAAGRTIPERSRFREIDQDEPVRSAQLSNRGGRLFDTQEPPILGPVDRSAEDAIAPNRSSSGNEAAEEPRGSRGSRPISMPLQAPGDVDSPPTRPSDTRQATGATRRVDDAARTGPVAETNPTRQQPAKPAEAPDPATLVTDVSGEPGEGASISNWLPMWLSMGLFASLAGNLFFGWIAWDTHARYQDLVDDINESDARAERPRRDDRDRGVARGGDKDRAAASRDYSESLVGSR